MPTAPVSRILFASCNSQQHKNVMWDSLSSRGASAFIWSGDAVYGDDFYPSQSFLAKKQVRDATPSVLQSLYSDLINDSGYQQLRRVTPQILGVFDDHDYGRNNGDVTFQYRQESGVLFVDFLKQSNDINNDSNNREKIDLTIMQRRAQAGQGVYGVKVLDFHRPKNQELLTDQEAGLETGLLPTNQPLSNRTVAIFLLDCRSHKTPWKSGWYDTIHPDYAADFLGDTQWEWLQESLKKSTATVNIIVNGLQVHADRFFDGNQVESWSRFPKAQHRLYQTILSSEASNPVLVSGDVHMAELSLRYCQKEKSKSSAIRRPLLEVTSSGLTHSWCYNVCARPSQSFMCRSQWMQYALCAGMHWAHVNPFSWTDVLDYSLERNFGEFEFDWDNRQLIVNVLGVDKDAPPLIQQKWSFDALSGKAKNANYSSSRLLDSDYKAAFQRLSGHGGSEMDWWCVNHAGDPSLAMKVFGVVSPMSLALFIFWSPLFLLVGIGIAMFRYRQRSRAYTKKPKQS